MAFVAASGTKFILNGSTWTPHCGVCYNYDNATGHLYTTAYFDDLIPKVVAMGLNSIRFFDHFPHLAGQDPTLESAWTAVDYGLDLCRQNNIKVNLPFVNYRSYLVLQGENPYTYDWSSFISFVLNRVNTVNGRTYKNDDTIFMVTIDGEPPTDTYGYSTFVSAMDTISTYIKTIDTNHLIDAGQMFENLSQNTNYSLWTLPNLDVRTATSYYNALQPFNTQGRYYPNIQAQDIQKPWWAGEFGIQKNNSSLQHQFNYMHLCYQNTFRYGGAGNCFWNMGNETAAGTFDVNSSRPDVYALIKYYQGIGGYNPRFLVK